MTWVLLEDLQPRINPKIVELKMANKENIPDEPKADQNVKYNLSKYEYDLYHEEDDVSNPVLRVKRFSTPNKGEKWKFFSDNKITFILEGTKLTGKEKEFLHTVEGVNFLLQGYKDGVDSFHGFKKRLKEKLKK